MIKMLVIVLFLVIATSNSYALKITGKKYDCANCANKMHGLPTVDVSSIQKVNSKQIEESPDLFETLQGTVLKKGCHFIMKTKKCVVRKKIGILECSKITFPSTKKKPEIRCK